MHKVNFSRLFLISVLLFNFGISYEETEIKESDSVKKRSKELHRGSVVIDLHTDALYYHVRGKKDITKMSKILEVDIPRLKAGGVDAQVFAIWPNPNLLRKGELANFVLTAIDTFNQICQRESHNISIALSPKDVERIASSGRIAGILAVEGGHALEGKLAILDTFWNRGVRLLTITWNNSNELGDSHADSIQPHSGLSKLGIQAIKKMNDLGMIIDVSHAAKTTFWDIIKVSEAPIIASHSGVRALCNRKRNLTDKEILAIAQKRGVIGIIFRPPTLRMNPDKASIEDVLNHIDYIVHLVGADFVALGSDFDGLMCPPPKGLEDATKFPDITYGLLKRGYSEKDIKKILGENFLRVWKEINSKSQKQK
ncbi:MAG: dipeptidase [candidate division WOR-3 bacterium]